MWCVCVGEVWTEGGFTLALFQGWGVETEVLLEQLQLNYSLQNKFIVLLTSGFLVENTTFKKCIANKTLKNAHV